MLARFYIPRLSNDMKIAVQKKLGGQTWYRSLDPVKKRRLDNLEVRPIFCHHNFQWYQSLLQFYYGTVKWCGKLAYLGYITPYGLNTEKYLTMPYHRLVFGSTNFHPLVQDFTNKNNEQIYK